MTNPTPTGDTASEPFPRTTDGPTNRYPGTPTWVKVSGIILVVLVLLVAIVVATGIGGTHGPMRHAPSGSGDAYASAIEMGA
jgi:hypothetical protein